MLTPLGLHAYNCWQEIPNHFPFVILDEFVVMPNHLHGLIIIKKTENILEQSDAFLELQDIAAPYLGSLPEPKNKFGPQSLNLASIIRGFKIGVTKFANANDISFAWQGRFHEHVIRDIEAHLNIRHYIRNNPSNWQEDRFYT